MTYYLTFVAATPNTNPLTSAHMPKGEVIWLRDTKAAEIRIDTKPSRADIAKMRATLNTDKIDVLITPAQNRRKRLLIADMDSTIVKGETLDDLAAFAGIKDQVAAITTRAMAGELDFEAAIKERVQLLSGLAKETLDTAISHASLNPGAVAFIKTMKNNNAFCVLVSGGFTVFTSTIAAQLGFDKHHGNVLDIQNEALSGKVIPPILDKAAKVKFMNLYLREQGLSANDCLAIGDGANDVPMLKAAGLGIGFHPKEVVAKEVDNVIMHGDLTAALYAQGYTEICE